MAPTQAEDFAKNNQPMRRTKKTDLVGLDDAVWDGGKTLNR
jgi:hypothetical protein